jgi:hypothetical protein
MTRPLDKANRPGSTRRDMADSTAVQVPAALLRCCRRAHSSPTMTSRALVAANRDRSSVRPAYLIVLDSTPGGESDLTGTVSEKLALCLDCSSRKLSQAAINVAHHLESLYCQPRMLVLPALRVRRHVSEDLNLPLACHIGEIFGQQVDDLSQWNLF